MSQLSDGEAGADLWLVVGLGNPGPTYAGHRHNIGYLVADELARRQGSTFKAHKGGRADVVEGRLGLPGQPGPRLVLVRPRCFMNEVGGPTKALMSFYKIRPDHLVAVHDELDIPFDTMRVKLGGGDNGHNGLRSIRSSLGSGDFYRLRVGIGRPPGRQPAADFVLKDFSSDEKKVLPNLISDAADAVEQVTREGLTAAQLRFHTSPPLA